MRLSLFRNCYHLNFSCEVGKILMTYYDSRSIPVSIERQVMTIPTFSNFKNQYPTFQAQAHACVGTPRDLRKRVYV